MHSWLKKISRHNFQRYGFKVARNLLGHYYIQNVKDRGDIQVYKSSKERVTHLSQFISVIIVKKILRKSSSAQFLEKLGKLKQNDGLLIEHIYILLVNF